MLVSAFSGFADKHLEQVSQSLRDIAVRLRTKMLHVAWIEPDINEAKRFFPRLVDKFKGWFADFTGLKTNHYVDPARFTYLHPFTNQKINGRARVITFQRFSP